MHFNAIQSTTTRQEPRANQIALQSLFVIQNPLMTFALFITKVLPFSASFCKKKYKKFSFSRIKHFWIVPFSGLVRQLPRRAVFPPFRACRCRFPFPFWRCNFRCSSVAKKSRVGFTPQRRVFSFRRVSVYLGFLPSGQKLALAPAMALSLVLRM